VAISVDETGRQCGGAVGAAWFRLLPDSMQFGPVLRGSSASRPPGQRDAARKRFTGYRAEGFAGRQWRRVAAAGRPSSARPR
jgi:hypothetical protein